MTLRHMEIFVAVCKYKSITIAAEKLHIAQPTVSLAIKELEEYYGVRLFDRISRKLYITEVGKQFLNYSAHIVSLFDEMEKGFRNWDSFGALRIGASITIGTHLLPQYVSMFYKQYPQIKVQAIIDNSEEIEKRVLLNDIDFALIEGAIHNSQIKCEKFLEDELILICGNQHVLCTKKQIDIEQLQGQDLILREKGSGARELFDSTMLIHNIDIKPMWESISTQAIIKAVRSGLGLSVLPYLMVKSDLEAGIVKHLKIKGITFKREFNIIHHKNKFLTKSAKEFIELCKTKM
jgi:DNA-binding transcriptional LysR family regulator